MNTQYKTSNKAYDSIISNNSDLASAIDIPTYQDNIKGHETISRSYSILAGVLAFCIPAVIFLMLCAVNHITPFGDRTFLYEDMKQQYMDFYAYYRAVLHGKDGFIYSAHSGLGSNMLGTWTYYLTSPFLIIFALVPERLFPAAVTFMTMMKIAAIGLTTWVFLRVIHVEDVKGSAVSCPSHQCVVLSAQDIIALICSTAFAFSGWVVANMTNSMWLDAVIVMPLFAAAYVKVLRYYGEKDNACNQRPIIYLLLSVMALLYANYYIGAMILLFAGIFTVILFVSKEIHIKEALRLLEGVVLGIVCDLWFLIPALSSLAGSNKDHSGKSADAFARFLPLSSAQEISLSPIKLISKLFSGSYDSIEIMEGLPNIYFGTALLIIVIMFFFNSRIALKKRIIAGVGLFTLVLFFCDKHLNIIAHGGTQPYGYLYRYSFLFSFACIILAYEELMNLREHNVCLLVSLFLTLISLLIAWKSGSRFMTSKIVVINIAIVLAATAIIWFITREHKNKKVSKYALILLGLILTADLSFNFIKVYASSSMMARSASEYSYKAAVIEADLKYIQENGDDSYRIVSLDPMTPNESLHFDYKGVTSYNSLLQIENRLLLYRMGFNDNGLYAPYEAGNTRCADALLGIKYIITDGNIKPGPGQRAFTDNIIENEYVLLDKMITSSNVETLLAIIDDNDNPFEVQEKLLNYLCGDSDLENPYPQNDTDHITVFSYAGVNSLSSSSDSAEYLITATASGELYFYMNRVNMEERSLQIYVNGEFISMYGNASCQKVIDLGYYVQDEEVSLRIITDGAPVPADIVVATEMIR
ncbi:YfhO family protein [Butyrivibrio fibrisolvens]|uniref:YfhO family protein n=1 Tax=Butyrivibrio fibrisolvens TaxID=831 RepID=UPI000480811D|nr:YfhO family protein [Butyrivibrio fibrisolvens]